MAGMLGVGWEGNKVAGAVAAPEMVVVAAAAQMAEILGAAAAAMQASHEYTRCRSL